MKVDIVAVVKLPLSMRMGGAVSNPVRIIPWKPIAVNFIL